MRTVRALSSCRGTERVHGADLGHWTYRTDKTPLGVIAQREGDVVIVYEHRFYGLSNPYLNLSALSFSTKPSRR